MRAKHRGGLSLVEILIGLGILAVAGLVFMMALRGSSREIEFSAEHFTADLLCQKVMEDCAQEAFLNPLGLECLGLYGSGETSNIIDGSSVFFSILDDTGPPWGRIDANNDGTIDKSMTALYRQVSDYQLQVVAQRPVAPPDPENSVSQVDIRFSWKSRTGRGEYTAQSLFSTPISPKTASPRVSFTKPEIEKVGACDLFENPEGSFGSLVSGSGADYDTAFGLARIQTACDAFLYSRYFVQTQKKLETDLDKSGTMNFAQPSAQVYHHAEDIASASYELAREGYRFIRYLNPDCQSLAGNLTPDKLGSFLLANPDNYKMTLKEYGRLYKTFIWNLNVARKYYEVLISSGMDQHQGRKKKNWYLLKLFNVYRLLYMVPGDSPVKGQDYGRFWKFMEQAGTGVYPALQRMAAQEARFAADRPLMLQKLPSLQDFSLTMANGHAFVSGFPPLPIPSPPPATTDDE